MPGYLNRTTISIPNSGKGLWQFWVVDGNLHFSVEDIEITTPKTLQSVTMPDIEMYVGAVNNGTGASQHNNETLGAWYYGINMDAEDTHNMSIHLNRLMIDLKRITI